MNKKSSGGGSDGPRIERDCFVFDFAQLRPGDIILSTCPWHLLSATIRFLTGSDYSHAILVLDPPYCIESSDYGVVKFRLDRFAVRNPENISILRIENCDPQLLNKITAFAETKVTSEYADKDVRTALDQQIPRTEIGKYFCSQLVAEAYLYAGISLTKRLPEKTSPGDLANSTVLTKKVDLNRALRFARAETLLLSPSFLDGRNQASPAEEESKVKQKICREIAPALAKEGFAVATFDEALFALVQIWSNGSANIKTIDREFSRIMRDSGLLDLTHSVFPPDCDAFLIDFYIRNALVFGDVSRENLLSILNFYEDELERFRHTNKERNDDVVAFKKMYIESLLETIKLHLAVTWEVLVASKRAEDAMSRAKEIIEMQLSGDF